MFPDFSFTMHFHQVPSVGTGSERKLQWVFQSKSESNSKTMSLLLLPMSGSIAFKRLNAEDEDGERTNPKVAKKEELEMKLESGLQSLGISEVNPQPEEMHEKSDRGPGQPEPKRARTEGRCAPSGTSAASGSGSGSGPNTKNLGCLASARFGIGWVCT
jgi:hypothetical protein